MRLRKKILIFFLAYFIFLYIFGVIIFKFYSPKDTDIEYDVSTLTTVSTEDTYAYLLEEREFSFLARLAIIAEAKDSIDISYYSITDGKAREIFYGALLNATNRGVNIRLILDGTIRTQTFSKAPLNAIVAHDNIEVKYYEPIRFLKPYSLQNTLHDKIIVVDETYGILGGRNIGDRYYFDIDNPKNMTYDRDVLIFGSNESHGTIRDMKEYFFELFNHKYSKSSSQRTNKKTMKKANELINIYKDYIAGFPSFDMLLNDIKEDAIQVERASFIRGPLTRMNKNPVIFKTLSKLSEDYDEVFVQSPYLILNKRVRDLFPDLSNKEVTVLTNSVDYNPNIFATSGYIRYRKRIAKNANLYEFQSESSIHAKSILMGEDISVIGSLNMDHRSIYLSTESVIVIYSEEFNNYFKGKLKFFLDKSLKVHEDGKYIKNENVVALPQKPFKRLGIYVTSLFTFFHSEML